jgi:amino acid adenylation domain-containing protein
MQYLLQHLLHDSAEAHADRPAIEDGARTVTYGDLETRSNRLARYLVDIGVARGDRVGIYLDKSADSIVAIYGALKAGAVYVPLDPHAPASRLGFICRDCDVRVMLTGREKVADWGALLDGGAPIESLVVLNTLQADALDGWPDGLIVEPWGTIEQASHEPLPERNIAADLAYILYTSGSTGQPKGVKLSHTNGLAFVDWAAERFSVQSRDRLSSHAPLHFDLSVFDLFAAAKVAAATVVVPSEASLFPRELAEWIHRKGITVWYSVPSVLSMLTLRGSLEIGDLPRLRTVLFAGEVFPTKYLRRLMELLPHVEFNNLYGPTETNVCTYYPVPPLSQEATSPIPIGKAIANVEAVAITESGEVAQQGEIGELIVRGPTVMVGYWGLPDETEKALIANPLQSGLRDVAYRTGDLVRQQGDGNFEFLGRRDAQVKSRGYRIELGEIESVLNAHPAVVECGVVAIPDEVVTNRIKAYVVARNGLVEADLIRHCSDRIPRYMIPEMFEFREVLPKTSTGKVDRQALLNDIADAVGRKG